MLGGERVSASDNATREISARIDGAVVMSVRNVSVRDSMGVDRLRCTNLSVHAGEIVGIAAVEGNGQHELLRLLAGRMSATDGEVTIPPVVGFIPEDRQRDALIQDFSLGDNVALLGAGARRGRMRWRDFRDNALELMRDYDVRATNESVNARTLSGGNQQKLVVGREIEGSHAALVAENPSRGLDVQAAAAIHSRIRAARDAGMAVVIYSSDLDEVIELADRVVVMYAGQVIEGSPDHESIGRAMLGLAE
jgi:simple sugar transport system ATP-binding protein